MQQRIAKAIARYFTPCGIAPAIPDLDQLVPYPHKLPEWWENNDNIFYIDKRQPPFALDLRMAPSHVPPRGTTVICRSPITVSITLWGEDSFVHIGRDNSIPKSMVCCGEAAVFFGDNIRVTWELTVNARNGGLVHFRDDCLVAAKVQCNTDDMHSIIDLTTGKRTNIFGGHILVGSHVWIGQESLLLGNTVIGNHAVIGARSLVKNTYPANCVLAGVPARVVRTGITWEASDLPPDL